MSVDTVPDLRRVRQKALAYIREGKARVIKAIPSDDSRLDRAKWVVGRVRGFRGDHWVHGVDGAWRCSCPERDAVLAAVREVVDQCPHIAAIALQTGWPSAAAPAHHPART